MQNVHAASNSRLCFTGSKLFFGAFAYGSVSGAERLLLGTVVNGHERPSAEVGGRHTIPPPQRA